MPVSTPFHIILQRKNQVLLSFLKIRAVVNGIQIYPLPDSQPVVIPLAENNSRLVITDGYHITVPLKLTFTDVNTCVFRVVCAISDLQLAIGFILLSVSYLGGLYTGMLLLKVFSFLPLVYGLAFYYLNRKEFLRLVPV